MIRGGKTFYTLWCMNRNIISPKYGRCYVTTILPRLRRRLV